MAYRETIKFLKFQEQKHPEEFKLVKIPKKFYNHSVHWFRLEHPRVLNETKTHYLINTFEDRAKTQNLIDSADCFREFDKWHSQYHPLVRSARATLKAIQGAA